MSSASGSYVSAKRRKIEPKYNASHLKRWTAYKSDMGVGKASVDHLVDFAECLLGEDISSSNNYLSTVVTYEVDSGNMVEDVFFERRYGKLRDRIRAIVGIFRPSAFTVVLQLLCPSSIGYSRGVEPLLMERRRSGVLI